MMTYFRKTVASIAALALLLGLLTLTPGDSSAANLTAGNYTFLLEGEEITFTVDPVSRRDGLLVPAEVFTRLDVAIAGQQGRNFTLTKGPNTVKVDLGSPLFTVNGKTESFPLYSVRLNGRLFLPIELLKYFGIDAIVDGTYVMIRDAAKGFPMRNETPEAYAELVGKRSFPALTRLDTSIYINAEYTLLNDQILSSNRFEVPYTTRMRLLAMSQTNTLVLVKLVNGSFRSGTLTTNGLFLIDSARRQFEVSQVFDLGEGMVNSRLAPGADRIGILVFPKVSTPGAVTVYYDAHNAVLGTFDAQ